MRVARSILVAIVVGSLLYIALGWKAVSLGWLPEGAYQFWSTVLGSCASLLALLSFVKPPLTKGDLQTTFIEDIKKIADTAQRLQELSEKRLEAESELQKLERRRGELEFLVTKASLSLHLRDKKSNLEADIRNHMLVSTELMKAITDYKSVISQLLALEEEVSVNEDLQEILTVLTEVSPKRSEPVSLLDFIIRSIVRAAMAARIIYDSNEGSRS